MNDTGAVFVFSRQAMRLSDIQGKLFARLDPGSEGKVLGMVQSKDAIALYNRRLVEEKQRRID